MSIKNDEISINVWEYQAEWETEKSFERFKKYYLSQEPPRQMSIAFRSYMVKEGGSTPEKALKSAPNATWQNWFHARNTDGTATHIDALTWKQRAEAYDRSKEEFREEQVKSKRRTIASQEMIDAETQLKFWGNLTKAHKQFFNHITSNTEGTPDVSRLIKQSKDLWEWREKIATFYRRAALMPSSIRESHSKEAENNPYGLEWEEKKYTSEEIGIGSEEIEDEEFEARE